ncbi:hypothetical protein [Pseudomonas violetae]|uniref:Uncharacterized protein n=1 Tax=Pseudomonas violetae TaxID=2915813 RepID=A0ABT0ETX1_9PSED|nr:hypothetical protein [Pseudomonas violetae]MCK1788922.1 hypothetical protein [Pseudomonas violetae]
MRKNIRDADLSGPFIERQTELTTRRQQTLLQLIDRMAFIKEVLVATSRKVLGYQDSERVRRHAAGWQLMWMWRSSRTPNKVSGIEVYLSKGSRGKDFQQVSLRSREERLRHMEPFLGRKAAKNFSRDLDRFFEVAGRAVGWINAFRSEDLGELIPRSKSYGLDRWIAAVGEACEIRSSLASGVVEKFFMLDEELNQAVFEFNEARQPVRFRSIICRRECPKLDPLSPAEPRYRVVEYFDRRTGKRRSRDVRSYKKRLQIQKVREKLKHDLGRDPTQEEVDWIVASQRKRMPSPWLTGDLISHCHLGKHSGSIVRHQKKLASILDEWDSCRTLIRSLL